MSIVPNHWYNRRKQQNPCKVLSLAIYSSLILLGPALLVWNNKPWTDKDLESVQSLGRSQKRSVFQTGRFGVGINTMYYITDVPFLGKSIVILFLD